MMQLTRPQHTRLAALHARIRRGEYPNCFRFAKEYEVSRKTVQRDIEFLRDSLRAPLDYDYARRGYYYTEPSWSMPLVDMTASELVHLLLAEQMAQQLPGTPLARSLEAFFERVSASSREARPVDPVFVRRQFSFHSAPTRPISEAVWTRVFDALRRDRVLKITYRGLDEADSQEREVEPIHLACVEGEWYLVAHDRARQGLRHFALSRIASAAVLDERFPFHEFDPKRYFANRFGRYVGAPGEKWPVVLRFDKSAAPWVLERIWHPRQRVEKNRDGGVTLSFPAPSLFEVKRWVLGWGGEVQVIRPAKLRRQIHAEAVRIARRYR